MSQCGKTMKSTGVLLLLGLLLLLLALAVRSGWFARQHPGEPLNAALRAAQGPRQLDADDARLVAQHFAATTVTPSGLRFIVRRIGSGPLPRRGSTVTVHYASRLLAGEKFDSSRDRGQPVILRLGSGESIAGMEEALLAMRAGEQRTVIIPYWLAYGERGRPPAVPPRATVVFDLELLAIDAGAS